MSKVFKSIKTDKNNKIGKNNKIQSLLFPIKKYTKQKALKWIKKHGYKYIKIDKTKDYLRFRQISPKVFKRFRTINIGKGIKAIYGIK